MKHGQGDEVNIELGELLETFRREVQQQVSGDAHSHYALGVSYLEMGLVDQAIESLRTHMSVRFDTSDEDPWLMAVLVRCADQRLRAASIEQLLLPWDGKAQR